MEDERTHFNPEDIKNFTIKALESNGYSSEASESIAYVLVEADKRGIFSHGVTGGAGLAEAILRKGILANVNPNSKPIFFDEKYPTIKVLNGNGSPGPLSSIMAIKHVKENARNYGSSKVIVNNANHFGAAGVWSNMIAEEKDLIGIVTCTTAACVKPLGDDPEGLDFTKGAGSNLRTGTNPIAISIPHEDGIITLDMAMTRLALSYAIQAFMRGSLISIPEYLADKEYESTLDPKEIIGRSGLIGSIFPLGSTSSGYKGDSLLRIIELLHSFGGGPIRKIKTTNPGPNERVSHTFEAMVVDFQYSKQEALHRVHDLMNDYEENYFGRASRWPADRSKKALEYVTREGIPYNSNQISILKGIARKSDLDYDSLLKSIGKKSIPRNIFNK